MEKTEVLIDPNRRKAQKIFWGIFSIFFVYATIKYNIIEGIDWFLISSYTLNKALAWNALTAVALSYSIGGFAKLGKSWAVELIGTVKYMGQWGFIMAMVHAVLSLRLLTPDLFSEIYSSNLEFNAKGNLLILFGILTLSALIMPGISSLPSVRKNMNDNKFRIYQKLGYLSLVFGLVHISVLGVFEWFNISGWQGFLPPITLIAFITAAIPLVLKLINLNFKK